ncbi:acetoacetate decarboxylase family protein [Salinarimonas sp.]|uniref:acetoacetate decarboxylase family protein n=1 Tax=Salinarimonas sp. TaxID=2766526 RepID=UPI0032D8D04E
MTDPSDPPYPPPPWRLTGVAIAALRRVPVAAVAAHLPKGTRPIALFGRTLVVGLFARYAGTLSYGEVLLAAPVRVGWRPALTILAIHVDADASIAGARALWAVPKEKAAFRFDVETEDRAEAEATRGGALLARLRMDRARRLPLRWPIAFRVIQARAEGRLVSTPVRATARIGVGRVRWEADPAGPYALLAGARPIVGLRLDELRLGFG